MDYFLLIIIFFICFLLINAQTPTESDTSVTNRSWFWPVLSISLALLLSIPSTLIVLILICYKKHKLNNNSEQSSIHSNSSISERYSRHVQGFRSPPPPYTTCDRPENVFMTPSLPPSYESHIPTTINVPPSTLTNPSIQTFQA